MIWGIVNILTPASSLTELDHERWKYGTYIEINLGLLVQHKNSSGFCTKPKWDHADEYATLVSEINMKGTMSSKQVISLDGNLNIDLANETV